MSGTEHQINHIKDRYGLSWQYGSDLPPIGGLIWYQSNGEILVTMSMTSPLQILEDLTKAVNDAQLVPRPYYPPLKKGFLLASKSTMGPHEVDLEYDCMIPDVSDHPASFAHVRKNHIHEGVDLYGQEHDDVYAMLPGVVTNIIQHFTGPGAGTPWWNRTSAVAVEDATGVWVYGEIIVNPSLVIGHHVLPGDWLGLITPVLKRDKGRPMSMLHLERYTKGTTDSIGIWNLNHPKPDHLLDPTPELIRGLFPCN